MKFPGADRLRQLRDAFLTSGFDQAASADFEAREAARAARANDLRLACAKRLSPYVGRLFLVNNFKEVQLEENAARISRAVLTKLGSDVPTGISALLSRGRENHQALLGTADALRVSLGDRIGERAVSLRPEVAASDSWLLSLARAAEASTGQFDLPPEELGHIAVASALDMNRHADISWVPAPGAAFMLTDVSEGAHFSWEVVSVHPMDGGAQIRG